MYDQIREEIFLMFYASVAMLSLIACCYLLFRQGNAFAKDVTPPRRLRRWTAAFFAAIALCHLWYLPTYFLTSSDDKMLGGLIAALLDSMTIIPLAIVVFLAMLQDRRRPLWPIALTVAPLIAGLAWCIATSSYALLSVLYVYYLLMWLGLIINMVRALRQYGRWLKKHCEDSQLYLQHDISISQLATLIGVNRSYLSQHFSSLGTTYNAYINGLRIQHFIYLYHEAVASHQPISVQQLAYQSGFRSYSTFYAVFKQSMGMTATEWMRKQDGVGTE